MAKAKKFSGDVDLNITPKSKSTTYQYDGAGSYNFNLNVSVFGDYARQYATVATKKNNDLVMTTTFLTGKGKIKTVTTTIKEYFSDPGADYNVKYESWWKDSSLPIALAIKPNTVEGQYYLYGAVEPNPSPTINDFLLGSTAKKAEEIVFDKQVGTCLYDTKGDDKYVTHHPDTSVVDVVYDLNGNDEYVIDGQGAGYGGILSVYDCKGNDTYTAQDGNAKFYIGDGGGNDKYEASFNSGLIVEDLKGNDSYLVSYNDNDYEREIIDYSGNDKYSIGNSDVSIIDIGGKDNYMLFDNAKPYIMDLGKGNDTYKVGDCLDNNNTGFYLNFQLRNEKGNETYNIAGLSFVDGDNDYAIVDFSGNDKYNFGKTTIGESTYDVYAKNVAIEDAKGNDNYTVTLKDDIDYADHLYFDDYAGKDTYTFTGYGTNAIKEIYTYDEKGNDKYNLTTVTNFEIEDGAGNDKYKILNCKGGYVEDYAGKDSYTLKSVSNGYLGAFDYGSGKDSYSVDISAAVNSVVEIYDEGGKDSLTLSGVSKSDLVFMTDVKSTNTYNTGTLYIYNKNNRSFVAIDNFYDYDGNTITGFGSGRIESVKAGKQKVGDVQSAALINDFNNNLREAVAGYLAEKGLGTVNSVLSGPNDDAKDMLAAYFTHQVLPS